MRYGLMVGLTALAAIAGASSFSPARAQGPAGGHVVVRCLRDGDSCVKFSCDFVGAECVRLESFSHSPNDGWRAKYYRPDGKWAWYGPGLVNCDVDGSHCVLLKH